MFKINCLLPTHDENDILEDCLESALTWSDNIYIYDTAGQEDTRELVKRVSNKYPNVHLYKSEFHSATKWLELSHDMFVELYSNSEVGDWWCFLYTDERYPEDPRLFLSKIAQGYNCVFSIRAVKKNR
jgi:cellulose synthase/poly-beta-1,6-N-acetylglucosamine synthase-like glycosyltransferase